MFRTEVRQVAASGGAQVGPTQWTHHDVLGRVLMTVTEAFDGNGVNKDLSAVCVDHDPSGRPTRQNLFFVTLQQADLAQMVQWPSGFASLEASEFRLDSADQRYQRRDFTSGTLTRITTYVGNLERIKHLTPQNGADREARLTLGSVIVTAKWSGATRTDQQRYVLRDHLGSADVIARPDGTVEETLSFDAHGRRHNASTYAYLLSYTDTTTRRGYTGHEHLDALATLRVSATRLHMNARIYDPERSEVSVANVGRFLQADTLIEADATQGLNRYTYVLNNALTHTDPTGRLSTAQRMFLTAVAWVLTPHVMTSLIDKGYSALTVKMGAGFVNGAIGGGMKGGVIGAFSAGLFHGIGSTFTKEITPWAFTGSELNIAGRMAKIAAHGTAAGVTEMLRGGKFGHGFVSAAGPELLHPEIGKLPGPQLQILGAALLGGALSDATGGKFANGAKTAAFMWAFNHVVPRGQEKTMEIFSMRIMIFQVVKLYLKK